MMESNEQQIKEVRSKTKPGNSETMATPKRVWTRPMYQCTAPLSNNVQYPMYSASVAYS